MTKLHWLLWAWAVVASLFAVYVMHLLRWWQDFANELLTELEGREPRLGTGKLLRQHLKGRGRRRL